MAATNKVLFAMALVATLLALFGWLTGSIKRGNPVRAALAVYASGPFAILLAGVGIERRGLGELAKIGLKVWALSLGDWAILPLAAAVLALAWRGLRLRVQPMQYAGRPTWFRTKLWLAASLAIGIAVGIAFHLYDMGHYTSLAANSPGKWVHDFLVFPAIVGGLVFGLVPALAYWISYKLGLIALALVLAWQALVAVSPASRNPDPREMHMQYDWDTLTVVPY